MRGELGLNCGGGTRCECRARTGASGFVALGDLP